MKRTIISLLSRRCKGSRSAQHKVSPRKHVFRMPSGPPNHIIVLILSKGATTPRDMVAEGGD